MAVGLLYVEGCPKWPAAGQRLRLALARKGPGDEPIEQVSVEVLS